MRILSSFLTKDCLQNRSEGGEVKAHGATQNSHHAVGYASNLKYQRA
ncbi:hypothetical protein Rin_00012980 [Candidatus Regiella insecticola 5.15]|uniref:Uncharacterized protein n=1 Tax=Candidatus Regiella insecticola 5.15 TaxID=1005043 RepID=G2GZS1_9ENTR|nr:hypothetical protein Rin_00012980 [Candidatus Regiella insecticola 5.15]